MANASCIKVSTKKLDTDHRMMFNVYIETKTGNEVMRYEIGIDNIILTCDVHAYVKKSPDFNTLDSDWDAKGYEELEFTVESALELDEDGLPFDLSSTEIDKLMADEWFVKLVEKELIEIIDAEKESEE